MSLGLDFGTGSCLGPPISVNMTDKQERFLMS